MQIQARPDHSLRVPRPDLSVKLGTPNACTPCHTDKPAHSGPPTAWPRGTARSGGRSRTTARSSPRRVPAQPGANEALARLAADRSQPAIVRATALDLLRNDPRTGDGTTIDATRDADPDVRAAAADSLEACPPRSVCTAWGRC